MTNRRELLSFTIASTLLAGSSRAFAQEFPSKPIKIVVPFPAGGSSDGTGRLIADKLGQVLKQSVVVDNKGGAGGMIGTDLVAKSAADGYTLVLVDVFHASTPIYTAKMPYDAVKDFTPISLIGKTPAFLLTHPGFEAKTAQDVLKYARANPDKLHSDCRHGLGGGRSLQSAQRHQIHQRALPRQLARDD